MSPSVQLLESVNMALRDALARGDWLAIGELDQRCRQAVDDAVVEPQHDEVICVRVWKSCGSFTASWLRFVRQSSNAWRLS